MAYIIRGKTLFAETKVIFNPWI